MTEPYVIRLEIPKSVIASDFVGIIMFTGALLFVGPNIYDISPGIAGYVFTCVPLAYMFLMIVAPLLLSIPIEDARLRQYIPDKRVRFRLSKRQPTRALDIGFYRCIIINEDDWKGKRQNWQALIGHEHAHIKNKDTLFFHFVGVSLNVFIALAGFRLLIFIYEIISFESGSFDPENHASQAGLVNVTLMLFGIIYMFMAWVRAALHNREYLADAAAYDIDPAAIEKWLQDRIILSQLSPIRKNWFSIDPILSWMTHPTFQARLDYLNGTLLPSKISTYGAAFRISFLIYANFLLMYLLFESGSENGVGPLLKSMAYLFTPLLLFATACTASLHITESMGRPGHLVQFIGVNFFLQAVLSSYVFYSSGQLDASYSVLPILFLFYVVGVYGSVRLIRKLTNANLYGLFIQCVLTVIGILFSISGRLLLGHIHQSILVS